MPARRQERLYAGFREHVEERKNGDQRVGEDPKFGPQIFCALISSVGTGLALANVTRVIMFAGNYVIEGRVQAAPLDFQMPEPSGKRTNEKQATSRTH